MSYPIQWVVCLTCGFVFKFRRRKHPVCGVCQSNAVKPVKTFGAVVL